MTVKPLFRPTALCAALAGAWGPALAQDAPADAHPSKPESFVSIGAGYWNNDRPRFGVYDGMPDKGFYGLLDALIIRRDDKTGTWFTFDGRDLGLDSREFRAEWLRQGDIGVSLEYNQIPYNSPFTVMTAVQGLGTPMQLVPTPSATVLGEWGVGTMREAWTAGFFKSLGGGADFRVSLKNEHKEGGRLWGRGGAPEFAAEPIDSDTRQLEAVLSYASKAFQIQGGYYGSWYTNRNSMVSTANVNAAGTTLTNPYFLSLPLDNQAQQLYLNGGYNFTERTRGTFKLAYTRATQDEDIPVGTGVPVYAGAPTHLDGQLDTTLAQLGITSRTTNSFSWAANLRYYNSDEKTPQYRVVQPAAGCGTCVDTTPLAFKTLTGKLEGTYRFTTGLSAMLGVEYSDQDRRVPFGGPVTATGVDSQRYVPWRAELQETTYYIQGRRSLSETLNGWIRYSHSKRDGSELTLTNEAQSDMINPIHIADRDRDKFRLMLDWAPAEALTLTFNAEYAQDKYGSSASRPYGLQDGEATLYSIDATYAISENWQMNAWYSRDNTKANQTGQRNANGGAAEAVKDANLEDTGDTFGAGVKGTFTSRVKGGLDLLYVKNVNRYPETVTPTGAGTLYPSSAGVLAVGPLPDIQNTAVRIKLYATYALQKQSEVRFDYIHEVWKTDDWTWLFANGSTFTYGATTDGTQVSQAPKQTSDFIGVRYIYRFQ
jgi:MtrB/PioB family decaheme-associated outer membrane protein